MPPTIPITDPSTDPSTETLHKWRDPEDEEWLETDPATTGADLWTAEDEAAQDEAAQDEAAEVYEAAVADETHHDTHELELELDEASPETAPAQLSPWGEEQLQEHGTAVVEEEGGLVSDFAAQVRKGLASAAVLAAVAAGDRDETALTNRVFFARHPELSGRRLLASETALAQEWRRIRDELVRPLLNLRGPAPSIGSVSGQRLRTQQLRDAWAAFARRGDLMVTVDVLGQRVQVNPRLEEAVTALGRALAASGYRADRIGGFSDRVIAGSERLSLHAYGVALDVDARHNPHRRGRPGPARWPSGTTQDARRAEVREDRADTSFTAAQIAAVRTIRTVDGVPVFFWAGSWKRSPDAMHFQVDLTPAELGRGLMAPAAGVTEAEAEWEEWDESEEETEGFQEAFSPLDLVRSIFRQPTVGFEFDVHYGPLPALPDSRLGDVLSTHTHAADGFVVKLDGPRLEINTRPFESTDRGLAELKAVAKAVTDFAAELYDSCGKVDKAAAVNLPGFSGARPFTHPKVTVPIGKLAVRGRFGNCSVWAAPQATVTVRLSRVAALVDKIKATEGDGPGTALTGPRTSRMGLRSEALYRARREVAKARKRAGFSDDLEGFLILLASYLWTSELPYRFPAPGAAVNPLVHDYEQIGKAYLPVNVKNPFHQVFSSLLSVADQQVFRSRFADGAARANLFRLARPGGATLADGDRRFLPTGRDLPGTTAVVHDFQKSEFGVVPTWNDLVEHTLDRTHRGWDDRLWVTHSKPKDVGVTRPRVLLELRRAGFSPVDRSKWGGFMVRMHQLTAGLDR